MHRIGGAILALGGAGLLAALAAVIYTPYPTTQPVLKFIGIPGVLVGDMLGLLAVMVGLWLAFAPAHAVRHVRRLRGPGR
jgi:hypothetical protein